MELDELSERLVPFCRTHLEDPWAKVTLVENAPGHAGFSYLFDVLSEGQLRRYFLRLPPPNVKLEGTADVLRQVAALNAVEGTAVPHATVLWSGDDPEWFGRPYFVVPRLEGDVLRLQVGEWGTTVSLAQRTWMAEQAMAALAGIHQVDWQARCASLGPPLDLTLDVTRWDRFYDRAADPELLALVPIVRQQLLDRLPATPRVGLFHGDFQWSNLFYAFEGKLLAVIDWELVGIGATLNDLGWILTFNDPPCWRHEGASGGGLMPPVEELQALYTVAYGSDPGDVAWYRALAAYKFAIISGFNLMLHRRGKRHDPHWEVMKDSMPSLMERANDLLR
jgi:aminoglycoside phosphotransferase (APT) family kinase protein